MSNAIWQLEANLAKLAVASRAVSLSGTVDLSHPARGLHDLSINGQRFESTRIFQVRPPQAGALATIEDAYHRGRDLIVTCAPSKKYPLRTQLCWRAHGTDDLPGSLGGIELIVSVETDLLGTNPQLSVESTIPAQRTLRYVESDDPTRAWGGVNDPVSNNTVSNGYLIYMPGALGRVAHFIHPDDYRDGGLSRQQTPQDTNCRIVHPLFAGDLEKGVILRGRMAVFFFTPVDGDTTPEETVQESAITAYRRFITQPLPLAN